MPVSKKRKKKVNKKQESEKIVVKYFNIIIKTFNKRMQANLFEDVNSIDAWITSKIDKYTKADKKHENEITEAVNRVVSYIAKMFEKTRDDMDKAKEKSNE